MSQVVHDGDPKSSAVCSTRHLSANKHATSTTDYWLADHFAADHDIHPADTAVQLMLHGTSSADSIRPADSSNGYPTLFRGTIDTGDGNDDVELASGSNGFFAQRWTTQDWGVVPSTQYWIPVSDHYSRGLGAWIDLGRGDDRATGSDGNDIIIGGAGSD